MELVLVTRHPGRDEDSEPTTADYRLEVNLGDGKQSGETPTAVPASEWPGASGAGAHAGPGGSFIPVDKSYKPHSLAGFSPFGSGRTNEFATWTMGRETFLSSPKLRESLEDDIRTFAERSDHTEGFMITTPMSDGFGGFTSVFLEMLRDEFTKSTIFTTGLLADSLSWTRADTERSVNQRLINAALSMQHLEELSSMVLPIQPPATWDRNAPWTRFLRDDLPKVATYSQVLTTHLQSANSELREVDGLTSIVNQLNWRGDNKIAHLRGASPLLPPEMLEGSLGLKALQDSTMDFSVLPNPPEKKPSARAFDPAQVNPFAEYTIVRGYEGNELERLGTILESSTALKEPLAAWICLPAPYPVLAASSPIYRSLLPTGRPLIIAAPTNADPLSPAGLFGLPDPLFPTASTYLVQPRSVPILTTLSTSPTARYLLSHLSSGLKELQRTRAACLFEYEEGEYGIGRDGLVECKERLETLADNHGAAVGGPGSDSEDEVAEDEDWGVE